MNINRKLKIIYSLMFFAPKKNINLGKRSYIAPGSKIYGTQVNINNDNGVLENLLVIGSHPLTIGKYCAIAGHLTIITSNHIMNKPNIQAKFQNELFQDSMDDRTKGPVTIGNNVWIGKHVIILPGINIGNGAVLGAGSVITKSVEPFTIVAGNPAKVIRKRFSEKTIKKLLSDPWWNWDTDKILKNKDFFITPLI